jgi:putative redox protein
VAEQVQTKRVSVDIKRDSLGSYRATNARGGELRFGLGEDPSFTPVELLLVAIAGCSAIDVDLITARRSEPTEFGLTSSGEKVRDEHGNRISSVDVTFTVRFPEGEAGDAARQALPLAVQKSHDRLCTVTRTVELGAPVTPVIV